MKNQPGKLVAMLQAHVVFRGTNTGVQAISTQTNLVKGDNMSEQSPITAQSNKVKKALIWLSETLQEHPDKKRSSILEEATIRFDLTPAECEFVQKNFSKEVSQT